MADSECPAGQHRNDAGDCVPNQNGESYGHPEGKLWYKKEFLTKAEYAKRIEEDNAGDSTQAGDGTMTDADNAADNRTKACPPGFHKDDEGNCVPDADLSDTTGEPAAEVLNAKQFKQMLGEQTNYFTKTLEEFKSSEQKKLELLAKNLGITQTQVNGKSYNSESAAFGKVGGIASSKVDDSSVKAVYESTVRKPANWFEALKKGTEGDVTGISWNINKEAFYETLTQKDVAWGGMPTSISTKNAKGEAITITGGDMPQIFSKQIYLIPGGRMRVPVRQFFDTQIIEDADRYNWYKGTGFDLDDTTAEGSEPTNEAQTISKVTATPSILRAVQTIKISDIENAPFDLVEYFNRAAALGGLKAEAKEALDTTYNAITPTNWVNANSGGAITDDDVASMTMKQEGIYAALDLIERQGGDTSPGNVVAFLHPKAIRELILDTAADFFTGQNPLTMRALGVLENRLGIDIVPTNVVHAQDNTTNDTYRNIVMVKGSIGLAVAADLQLEAQRRPDLSAVKVGARYRAKAAVIDETMTCRVSSAQ